MTHLEKTKAEISSILDEYKHRFPVNSDNKPANTGISTSDIYLTTSQIKSEMISKMEETMTSHIEIYGDDDKPEIIEHIKACGVSFQEFLSESL